jgi:hypothetical protein
LQGKQVMDAERRRLGLPALPDFRSQRSGRS